MAVKAGNDKLRGVALDILSKRTKQKELILNHDVEARGRDGKARRVFWAAAKSDPNGPQFSVALDEEGVERESFTAAEAGRLAPLAEPLPVAAPIVPFGGGPITINPTTNNLTLAPGQTFNETITVTVPADATVNKADIYFLTDATGSMTGIINSVKAGATMILNQLAIMLPGVDLSYGVGNYNDFPGDPSPFHHQLSPAANAADPVVAAAINTWTAAGGGDTPEANLFALNKLAVAPGVGPVGWRPGTKRIIVWFGDAPGHDPICAALNGGVALTETQVRANLAAQGIFVIAISTGVSGLDADPSAISFGYPCAAGGSAGQATRIVNDTGGTLVTGVNPATVVNTIISLVSAAVSSINNVSLVPAGATAPFVVSITPAGGYGPLSGSTSHTLKFDVVFKGVMPCADDDQVFNGTLDVVADGAVVAQKKVTITVEACPPKELYTYCVKFVCGLQRETECSPVRPGIYATEININNYSDRKAPLLKYLLPLVRAGEVIGREPRFVERKLVDKIVLPPHSATMDDCCRIEELLFGKSGGTVPITIGFLEIVSRVELCITAVYTVNGLDDRAVSIDVEKIGGHKIPAPRGWPKSEG